MIKFLFAAVIVLGLIVTTGGFAQRGAVLILFPLFFWPIKLELYQRYLTSSLNQVSKSRAYLVATARIALGVGLALALFPLVRSPLILPTITLVSWSLIYWLAGKRDSFKRKFFPFVFWGTLISIAFNALSFAITGAIGFGC